MSEVVREDGSTSQWAKVPQKLSAVCTLAHVHPFGLESRDRWPVGEPNQSSLCAAPRNVKPRWRH